MRLSLLAMCFVLAASEPVRTFDVVSLVIQTLMGIGLFYVATIQRRSERKEDKRNADMQQLEARLHETAAKLVEERFRAMTHSLNNHVHGFTTALDELKARVNEANEDVDGLVKEDHQLEVKTLQRMEEIK